MHKSEVEIDTVQESRYARRQAESGSLATRQGPHRNPGIR
jgi:hypothetical protein